MTGTEVVAEVAGEATNTIVLVVGVSGAEHVVGRLVGREPDLLTVEVLTRMALEAQRIGCALRLRNPCPHLCELLDLVGLAELLIRP